MKGVGSIVSRRNNLAFGVILLLILLLSGISLVPAIYVGATVQQQQQLQSQQPQPQQQQSQQQPNQIGVSQIVKQIAQKVAAANLGTNIASVEKVLTELVKQNAQYTSEANAIEEVRQISSQVTTYPFGTVSQSLATFANQSSADSTTLIPTIQKTIQEKKSSGKDITQSVVDTAVQEATGGGKNVNDLIRQAAQIISRQAPGVPLEKIESIIIQIALQFSQSKGKAIGGQALFGIANQIVQNPNGIFTQAIIQLVKQDTNDGGKTGQTVNVIKKVVKESDDGRRDSNRDENNDGRPSRQTPPRKTPNCTEAQPGQHCNPVGDTIPPGVTCTEQLTGCYRERLPPGGLGNLQAPQEVIDQCDPGSPDAEECKPLP
jgi:hypothetical protein